MVVTDRFYCTVVRYHTIAYSSTATTMLNHTSDSELTNVTIYIALMGELWCTHFGTLDHEISRVHKISPVKYWLWILIFVNFIIFMRCGIVGQLNGKCSWLDLRHDNREMYEDFVIVSAGWCTEHTERPIMHIRKYDLFVTDKKYKKTYLFIVVLKIRNYITDASLSVIFALSLPP